jgi:ferredoxin-NADP reductase
VRLFTVPIHSVRTETPRTRVLQLALQGQAFEFCAGQSVKVGAHGQVLRKPYSLAGPPEQARTSHLLELLVQVDDLGNAGPHLGEPAAGMLVDVSSAFGSFCFPQRPVERHFLFVAGGTGIAPLRSMIWHALELFPDRQISLLYSARTEDEFAYGEEMRSLARRRRIVLRETVTRGSAKAWAGDQGRITHLQLAAMLLTTATRCFVCGPPPLVADVSAWLGKLGVEQDRIVTGRD